MTVQNLNVLETTTTNEKTATTKVVQYGVPLRALLTNFSCIFGLQSGVAAINPEVQIRGVLQKRLPVSINWDRLPAEVKEFFRKGDSDTSGKDNLLDWVEAQIERLSEEEVVFNHGEEILGLHLEPSSEEAFNVDTLFGKVEVPRAYHHTFLKNTKLNQPLLPRGILGLKKGKDEEEDGKGFEEELTSDIVKFNVVCDLDVNSQWWKLRGDGIKATTCPISLKFYNTWDSSQEVPVHWDVMFGIESLKGGLAYLSAYVNTLGGGCIDVEEGIISMNNGEKVPLDDVSGPAQKWVGENTQALWVEFPMINAEFRSVLVKRDPKSIALDANEVSSETDLVLVSIEEDHVVLRERIEVLASFT